jgi:hypothetical protein
MTYKGTAKVSVVVSFPAGHSTDTARVGSACSKHI